MKNGNGKCAEEITAQPNPYTGIDQAHISVLHLFTYFFIFMCKSRKRFDDIIFKKKMIV